MAARSRFLPTVRRALLATPRSMTASTKQDPTDCERSEGCKVDVALHNLPADLQETASQGRTHPKSALPSRHVVLVWSGGPRARLCVLG
mmetsp:Transcript_20591/g.44764  ORF Transcript_20591/g.44764 Transcript_20591/m.44764 type:complete len:89 (-) Transcript_20591:3-269(-)